MCNWRLELKLTVPQVCNQLSIEQTQPPFWFASIGHIISIFHLSARSFLDTTLQYLPYPTPSPTIPPTHPYTLLKTACWCHIPHSTTPTSQHLPDSLRSHIINHTPHLNDSHPHSPPPPPTCFHCIVYWLTQLIDPKHTYTLIIHAYVTDHHNLAALAYTVWWLDDMIWLLLLLWERKQHRQTDWQTISSFKLVAREDGTDVHRRELADWDG